MFAILIARRHMQGCHAEKMDSEMSIWSALFHLYIRIIHSIYFTPTPHLLHPYSIPTPSLLHPYSIPTPSLLHPYSITLLHPTPPYSTSLLHPTPPYSTLLHPTPPPYSTLLHPTPPYSIPTPSLLHPFSKSSFMVV